MRWQRQTAWLTQTAVDTFNNQLKQGHIQTLQASCLTHRKNIKAGNCLSEQKLRCSRAKIKRLMITSDTTSILWVSGTPDSNWNITSEVRVFYTPCGDKVA